MLIFIDESGDSGFKITKGSSEYFVISLVIFKTDTAAQKTSTIISSYREKMGLGKAYEFKFNRTKQSLKIGFLESIKDCKFTVRSIVVKKDGIYSKELRGKTKSFYNFFLKLVLEHNNNTIRNAKIRLDGFGERKFKQAMTTYLRKELNVKTHKNVMKNFKFRDSKKDNLIQLADMVAGSIRRSYQRDKGDYLIYKDILKERISDEWVFK